MWLTLECDRCWWIGRRLSLHLQLCDRLVPLQLAGELSLALLRAQFRSSKTLLVLHPLWWLVNTFTTSSSIPHLSLLEALLLAACPGRLHLFGRLGDHQPALTYLNKSCSTQRSLTVVVHQPEQLVLPAGLMVVSAALVMVPCLKRRKQWLQMAHSSSSLKYVWLLPEMFGVGPAPAHAKFAW